MISLSELTPSQTLLRLITTKNGLNDMTEQNKETSKKPEQEELDEDQDFDNLIQTLKDIQERKKIKANFLRMTPEEWENSKLD